MWEDVILLGHTRALVDDFGEIIYVGTIRFCTGITTGSVPKFFWKKYFEPKSGKNCTISIESILHTPKATWIDFIQGIVAHGATWNPPDK